MSVEQYVHGKKDVLVATDIASKGLDFPNIQHVINYDMPEDIENYGQLCVCAFTCCMIVMNLSHSSDIYFITFTAWLADQMSLFPDGPNAIGT